MSLCVLLLLPATLPSGHWHVHRALLLDAHLQIALSMPSQWGTETVTKSQIPREEHEDEAHGASIYALQVRGDLLVTASADKTIRKWSIRTRRLLQSPLSGHEASVLCLQFDDSPAQDVLISGSADSSIRVWRLSTGDVEKLIDAHVESVLSLHFDENHLVSGGKDKTVRLWNRRAIQDTSALPEFVRSSHPTLGPSHTLEEYTLLATLTSHQAAVNAVQLHGDTIVSGAGDRKINVWNLQTGQVTHSISPHTRGIADMQFNGRLLLAGSSDNTAAIYDVEGMVEKARLTGHKNLIRAVDATPSDGSDFTRIVTGSYDGTLCIWEKEASSPEQWVIKSTLEYGVQPQPISDDNPYVHTYIEAARVFDVCFQNNSVFCSGQGNTVVKWQFSRADWT